MVTRALRPLRATGTRKLEIPSDTASSPVRETPPFAKALRM